MDGVLVVDKPVGVTSHDVVATARRALQERRIGHTGTLDPMATGVLPLAIGRATRLVRFLSSSTKTYEAGIRFGLVTDSYDITGQPVRQTETRPTEAAVRRAVLACVGEQMQTPPAFSAKKIDGQRAYALARQDKPVALRAVPVRIEAADLLDWSPDRAVVRLTVSAGFYVRSFAYDLGEQLGTGACLDALRRTRSGSFDLSLAVTLEQVRGGHGPEALVGLDALLPDWDTAVVGPEGRGRLGHGQTLLPGHLLSRAPGQSAPWVRVVDEAGHLLGLATDQAGDGALHPDIVLI